MTPHTHGTTWSSVPNIQKYMPRDHAFHALPTDFNTIPCCVASKMRLCFVFSDDTSSPHGCEATDPVGGKQLGGVRIWCDMNVTVTGDTGVTCDRVSAQVPSYRRTEDQIRAHLCHAGHSWPDAHAQGLQQNRFTEATMAGSVLPDRHPAAGSTYGMDEAVLRAPSSEAAPRAAEDMAGQQAVQQEKAPARTKSMQPVPPVVSFPGPTPAEFSLWFPGLGLSRTSTPHPRCVGLSRTSTPHPRCVGNQQGLLMALPTDI